MKLINSIIAAIIALVIILFAVSNRGEVALELWPLPYRLTFSLYAVILLSVLAGFIVGVVAAWLMGAERRRELRRLRRQAREHEQSLARHQLATPEK